MAGVGQLILRGRAAVLPQGLVGPTELELVGDRIVAVHPLADSPSLTGTLVPGFVDLQVNGIGAIDVAQADGSDWDVLDEALLAQGVTAWCPTLVSAPLDRYAEPLARIAAAARCGRRSWAHTWKARSWASGTGRTRTRSSWRPTWTGSLPCRRSSGS